MSAKIDTYNLGSDKFLSANHRLGKRKYMLFMMSEIFIRAH